MLPSNAKRVFGDESLRTGRAHVRRRRGSGDRAAGGCFMRGRTSHRAGVRWRRPRSWAARSGLRCQRGIHIICRTRASRAAGGKFQKAVIYKSLIMRGVDSLRPRSAGVIGGSCRRDGPNRPGPAAGARHRLDGGPLEAPFRPAGRSGSKVDPQTRTAPPMQMKCVSVREDGGQQKLLPA